VRRGRTSGLRSCEGYRLPSCARRSQSMPPGQPCRRMCPKACEQLIVNVRMIAILVSKSLLQVPSSQCSTPLQAPTPMAMSAVRWPYPVLASWLEQQNINETCKRSANIIAPTLAKMQTTGVMSHTVRALVVSLADLLYVLHSSVLLILNLLRAPALQVSNKSPVSFSSR